MSWYERQAEEIEDREQEIADLRAQLAAAERERDEARKALRLVLDCRHPNDESLPLADMLPDDVRHASLVALNGEPTEPAPQGQAEGEEARRG